MVVSFGAPQSRDQYIHRIGRTGRAGKDGQAILLISPYEKGFLKSLDDLPVKDELAFSPQMSSVPEHQDLNQNIVELINRFSLEDRESLSIATLGFRTIYSNFKLQGNVIRHK